MSIISGVIVKPTGGKYHAGLIPSGGLWNFPIGLGAEGYPPCRVPYGWDDRRSDSLLVLSFVFDIPNGSALRRARRIGFLR